MSDSVSDSVGRPESGTWLPLGDAARFLRVTVRTLDRRGLPKRRLPGHLTEVWVSGASEDDVSALSETSDGQDDVAAERALALSERVSDVVGRQLAPVVAALERSQAIVRQQAETIGELRVRVTTLEAENA